MKFCTWNNCLAHISTASLIFKIFAKKLESMTKPVTVKIRWIDKKQGDAFSLPKI